MKLILLLSLISLIGCRASAPDVQTQSVPMLQLSYLNQKIDLPNNVDVSNVLKILDGSKIYLSNYLDVPADRQKHFIDIKKRIFLELFQDDIEPYSHLVFKRALCLIRHDADIVIFNSGERTHWSNCSAANQKYTFSRKAIRFWRSCHGTVWEITVKDLELYNKMTMLCDGVEFLNSDVLEM